MLSFDYGPGDYIRHFDNDPDYRILRFDYDPGLANALMYYIFHHFFDIMHSQNPINLTMHTQDLNNAKLNNNETNGDSILAHGCVPGPYGTYPRSIKHGNVLWLTLACIRGLKLDNKVLDD